MIENVLIPKFSNTNDNNDNNNTDAIFDGLVILFTDESARSYFAKTSLRDFVASCFPTTSRNLLLKVLADLASNNVNDNDDNDKSNSNNNNNNEENSKNDDD